MPIGFCQVYAGSMKRPWLVLVVVFAIVLVGLLFMMWRTGLLFRTGVELMVNTDKVAVYMDDDQALVDLFAEHGWWETGVRTIDGVVDGTVEQLQPKLVVIEITDEVQPFRDMYQGEVFGSYAVYRRDGKVVVKVQVNSDGADARRYGRILDTELTKAAIMESLLYSDDQEGEVYNQYLKDYQTNRWPGFLRVEAK